MVELTQDLFTCCALIAFIEEAVAVKRMPDSGKVQARAYAYYERELIKGGNAG